jgi:tetratricopeptide (TPR) repeat protein
MGHEMERRGVSGGWSQADKIRKGSAGWCLNRRRSGIGATVWVAWLLVQICFSSVAEPTAASFDNANKLYERGKFAEAAESYEKLIQTGPVSEAMYFNWGNALFKAGRIGRALAAYEEAQRMAPRDPDVRANLQFARNQVQGPTLLPEYVRRGLNVLTLNEWTVLAAAGVWLWLLLLSLIQVRPELKRALRPYVLWGGLAAVALCVCFSGAFYFDRLSQRAIVVTHEAVVRQAPLDESQSAFTLHDGAELQVLDQKDQWFQVQADPKRIGWVHKEAVLASPRS